MAERSLRVADFDGTVTDLQREAEGYLAVFAEELEARIGMPQAELHGLMETAKSEILANPGIYGWEYEGLIVAPAVADPYLLSQAQVGVVVEKLRDNPRGLKLPEPAEMGKFLSELHSISYQLAGVAFRDGALRFVTELHNSGEFAIVTNSGTEAVLKKLKMLLGNEDHGIKVVGEAKKYRVNQQWEKVGESIKPAGFPRPVYLRREEYGKVLTSAGRRVSVVIGDVYELDLALPEALGMTTVLVTSPMTPLWELKYYKQHSNGFSAASLDEVTHAVESGRI